MNLEIYIEFRTWDMCLQWKDVVCLWICHSSAEKLDGFQSSALRNGRESSYIDEDWLESLELLAKSCSSFYMSRLWVRNTFCSSRNHFFVKKNLHTESCLPFYMSGRHLCSVRDHFFIKINLHTESCLSGLQMRDIFVMVGTIFCHLMPTILKNLLFFCWWIAKYHNNHLHCCL